MSVTEITHDTDFSKMPVHEKKDFDYLIKEIEDEYHFMERQVEGYKKTLKEFSKDSEIEKLREELHWVRRHSLQMLTDREMKKLQTFKSDHTHSCYFRFDIVYMGIDASVQVTCQECGESLMITG